MSPDWEQLEKLLDAKFDNVQTQVEHLEDRLNRFMYTMRWTAASFVSPTIIAVAIFLLGKVFSHA
jgi:hypothetical protein